MEEIEDNELEQRGGQMSFLEHLDELRKRLVYSVVIIVVAFFFCWFVSGYIYAFLEVPIRRALSEAERQELPVKGLTGDEKVLPLASLKEGDRGRFVFDRATKLGASVVQPGTSVESSVSRDSEGIVGLFT
jgi:sec-independent protein translocase protein TatC